MNRCCKRAYLVSRCGDHTRNPALAHNHASRNLREGKFGALPRNHNVAVADELYSPAEADPIDGGNEGLGERPPLGDTRETGVSCGKRSTTACGFEPTAEVCCLEVGGLGRRGDDATYALRSAPAQNARLVPVMMMTLIIT